MKTKVLFGGRGEGELLLVTAPISFWGGIDSATGRIVAPQHPQFGAHVRDRLLALPATIGSSSSSSVLLELIRVGQAPAGLILGRADAILVVGCIVARELGYRPPPVVELPPAAIADLHAGRYRLTDGAAQLLPC